MPPPAFFSGLDQMGFAPLLCLGMPRQAKPKGPPRQKFSVREDEQLRELVEELGQNWPEVAQRLGTRSARQCRERFRNYLSPNLRNGLWSDDEDRLLHAKVAEFGAKWSVIVSFFPSRSEVNLKNRWTQLSHREAREVVQAPDAGEMDGLDWDFVFSFTRQGFEDDSFAS